MPVFGLLGLELESFLYWVSFPVSFWYGILLLYWIAYFNIVAISKKKKKHINCYGIACLHKTLVFYNSGWHIFSLQALNWGFPFFYFFGLVEHILWMLVLLTFLCTMLTVFLLFNVFEAVSFISIFNDFVTFSICFFLLWSHLQVFPDVPCMWMSFTCILVSFLHLFIMQFSAKQWN